MPQLISQTHFITGNSQGYCFGTKILVSKIKLNVLSILTIHPDLWSVYASCIHRISFLGPHWALTEGNAVAIGHMSLNELLSQIMWLIYFTKTGWSESTAWGECFCQFALNLGLFLHCRVCRHSEMWSNLCILCFLSFCTQVQCICFCSISSLRLRLLFLPAPTNYI